MQNSGFAPLDWFSLHWQVICGWGTALIVLYKFFRWIGKATSSAHKVVVRATDAEETIKLIATNHLPHIQIELEKLNETMTGIREDFVKVLLNSVRE